MNEMFASYRGYFQVRLLNLYLRQLIFVHYLTHLIFVHKLTADIRPLSNTADIRSTNSLSKKLFALYLTVFKECLLDYNTLQNTDTISLPIAPANLVHFKFKHQGFFRNSDINFLLINEEFQIFKGIYLSRLLSVILRNKNSPLEPF